MARPYSLDLRERTVAMPQAKAFRSVAAVLRVGLGSWDRRVWRGSGRAKIVQAQFRRIGTGFSVMRTKPCARARGLVAAPVKWPGSRSLGVVLKAAT
jgi:hypothetical protein